VSVAPLQFRDRLHVRRHFVESLGLLGQFRHVHVIVARNRHRFSFPLLSLHGRGVSNLSNRMKGAEK
jgi:hypothetical protein